MSEENHRLVILGSMDEFVDLVECAKKRGIYTIVCDGYEDGPAKAHADKAYLEDVRHTDAIAEICRKEQADGIIASFSDLLAECMIDIADAAGLPSYLKPKGEKLLREKPLMKQMFQELGIASPRYKKIRLDTLEEDFADMAFPCVIKPVNGYGSHGVFVGERHRGRSRALPIDRQPNHVRLPDGRGVQRRTRIQHHDLDRGRASPTS